MSASAKRQGSWAPERVECRLFVDKHCSNLAKQQQHQSTWEFVTVDRLMGLCFVVTRGEMLCEMHYV